MKKEKGIGKTIIGGIATLGIIEMLFGENKKNQKRFNKKELENYPKILIILITIFLLFIIWLIFVGIIISTVYIYEYTGAIGIIAMIGTIIFLIQRKNQKKK